VPTVFLSYARDDIAIANQLASRLSNHKVSVWRDQEKIYAGQRWPKTLGEAISVQDFLLLLWSKNAAKSSYVELEWCTAIALKKTIIPCLLDDTALPASLRAINAIHANELTTAISGILSAVSIPVPATDPNHIAAVVKQLGGITARDPQDVMHSAQAMFEQRHWTAQGNVYQAAGNIFITTHGAPVVAEKTIVEKWQTWVALIVSSLTVVTLVAQLPKVWLGNNDTENSLQGEYSGTISFLGKRELTAVLEFEQTGNLITGAYNNEVGDAGIINGSVKGNSLYAKFVSQKLGGLCELNATISEKGTVLKGMYRCTDGEDAGIFFRKSHGIRSNQDEQKLRAEFLADIRKAFAESSKIRSTKSGLAPYDESYISAAVYAMRQIGDRIGGVRINSTVNIKDREVNKDDVEATSFLNFGNTLRLSWKTTIANYQVTKDTIRLDVFPDPEREPTKSFTIVVENFMLERISEDFSTRHFDLALQREGFEIKEPMLLSDGTLQLKCQYKLPDPITNSPLIVTGVGLPSNYRTDKRIEN
jgi:hypothetical protein